MLYRRDEYCPSVFCQELMPFSVEFCVYDLFLGLFVRESEFGEIGRVDTGSLNLTDPL
jgi:hypothetical protein